MPEAGRQLSTPLCHVVLQAAKAPVKEAMCHEPVILRVLEKKQAYRDSLTIRCPLLSRHIESDTQL